MKPAAAALFLAAAVLACGCGPPPSETSRSPPDGRKPPDTARVVCDRDGTRVLTPEVAAQRDGVHLVIDNRLEGDYGFSGGNGNAPRGESGHVVDHAPGKVRMGCYESYKDMEPDYETLEILSGDSGYKSVELECGGGMAVQGGPQYAAGAKGEKGDPVELARRMFSDEIEDGDVVESAGYPESRGNKTVRVVRGGRVVAVVEYFRAGGGWLQDNYTACESF